MSEHHGEAEDVHEGGPQDAAKDTGRLPSFTDVNLSIGQFMAGLEQKILHNRPPAVVVVEEEARSKRVVTSG